MSGPSDEMPARSWQSALRQLADTLAPGTNVEIDPMDPEVSCARIAEAVGRRIANLPQGTLGRVWDNPEDAEYNDL